MALQNFTAGQVLDVTTLNSLVSNINNNTTEIAVNKSFPKVATFNVAGDPSTTGSQNGGAGFRNLTLVDDPDGIAIQGNATTLFLEPGEYSVDIPLRVHSAGWQYAQLYIGGVSIERISAYCSTSSMNTNPLKKRFTITQPGTSLQWYFEGGNHYASMGSVTKLRDL